MWVVIHIVSGKTVADKIEGALMDEGILVRVKPAYKGRIESENDYQICVLRSEVDTARAVLASKRL